MAEIFKCQRHGIGELNLYRILRFKTLILLSFSFGSLILIFV